MSKVKSFHLMMIAAVIFISLPLAGITYEKKTSKPREPDTIEINIMTEKPDNEKAGNEMLPVDFLHTVHNQAVEGQCIKCHIKTDTGFVFKFKRQDQQPSMEFYHDNCITCHIEQKQEGKKSGPMAAECRSCHGSKRQPSGMAWEKINFDKSLHFVHETSKAIPSADPSETDNCSACHHKYNEKTKQTYFVPGEEESCTYCHKGIEKEGIRSLKTATHDSCVSCHLIMAEKEITAGPVTCQGCHTKTEQAKIKPAQNITRMKRNQPDEVFMTGLFSKGEDPKYLMTPVAFDHKSHEKNAESCIACHHDTLKKCRDCHSPTGDVNGNFIPLEQAMHSTKTSQSCVGCHAKQTKKADCAGCHDLMPDRRPSENNCITCHNTGDNTLITDKDLQKAAAAQTLKTQSSPYSSAAIDKIPETVTIDSLAKEYKPSQFPHRKMVAAIADRVETSDLAKTFHQGQETLCLGCHHNSPPSTEPPKCGSCHGKKTDIENGRPHLKGAYHGQCISCHEKMQVKTILATECVKCHEKK